MADNIVETQELSVEQQQQQQEVANMMAISLNGGLPPEVVNNETQVVVEEEKPVVTDFFGTIKEKWGYETQEAALAEFEQLRSLKEKHPVQEIKFENEDSEKLFKLLQTGNTSEVYEVLAQQQKINALVSSEVNASTAGDIIKLGLQLKHKDLTQDEINYKFNKQYGLPKEPVQSASELDEEFLERKANWEEQVRDIEMSRIIDAKLLKPELESAKSQIKLPELPVQEDESYTQWKKTLEEDSKLAEERERVYKSLTPKSVETKLNFKDDANKINFDFQFEPDSEGFNKSVDMALDISKFFDSFVKSDGTPDREGFLKAIHFATNKDAYLLEAMKQAKNATIKSFLPDNSNGGAQRQFPQGQELSELDKMMQASLNGFQPTRR